MPTWSARRMIDRPAATLRRLKAALTKVEDTHGRVESIDGRLDALAARLDVAERSLAAVHGAAQTAARMSLETDPSHVRVVFLIHNTSAWSSIESVVEAMGRDERFEPILVSIPKRFPGDVGFGGEEEVHRFLKERAIAHWRFNFEDSFRGLDILRGLLPDLIFRQSQWDADVQPGYSTENLAFTRLGLIGYEMLNLVRNVKAMGDVKDTAVDSPFHRACWRVFTANDLTLRQARKNSAARGHQYVTLGHPRMDALRRAVPAWPVERDGARRPRVVWNAHHSINTGWNDFGMFPVIWRDMVAWAADAPEVDFVFSPHPGLRTMMGSPLAERLTPEDVEEFWRRWRALPNTGQHLNGDYLSLLTASDLLVTDGISALFEYQLAYKPVVFVERPDHIAFNRLGKIAVQGVHRVDDVPGARAAAEPLLAGTPDPLEATQRANMERLFGASEDVGAAIVDYIAREIEAEARTSR